VLSVLGLSAGEEAIYRCLVGTSGMSPTKIAAETGRDPAEVDLLLAVLTSRGLALAESTGEFAAAPPAVALGALLRQQHDALREAELDLLGLAEEHRHGEISRAAADLVEVITDVEAVRQRYTQIHQGARREVRSMVVPKLTVVKPDNNPAVQAVLRRGVRSRAIVDRAVLLEPGMATIVAESMAAGEEIRVVDRVPVKLIIADSEVAMLPLMAGQNTAPASVLVRASGLLDALIAYFEATWARAYPLTSASQVSSTEVDEVDTQVLTLLLGGLTDQAVASQLGISLRSVQRRIAALMDRAGVTTRIQLGWHASRHNWA
jgi:hypothetical protein